MRLQDNAIGSGEISTAPACDMYFPNQVWPTRPGINVHPAAIQIRRRKRQAAVHSRIACERPTADHPVFPVAEIFEVWPAFPKGQINDIHQHESVFAVAIGDPVVHLWINCKVIVVEPERLGPCVMRLEFVAAAETLVCLDLQRIVGIRGIGTGVGDFLVQPNFL